MTEAIDTACWMRRGESPVTHERLAKGGMICRNGVYQMEFTHVIDWLEEKEIITAYHKTSGERVITLQRAANALHGTEAVRKAYHEAFGEDGVCPSVFYRRVVRIMKELPWQWHMIERICFEPVFGKDLGWMFECKTSIEKSFENLTKTLDEQYKLIQNVLHNDGISVPEIHPQVFA